MTSNLDALGLEAALDAEPNFPGQVVIRTVRETLLRGTPNPKAYLSAAILAYLSTRTPDLPGDAGELVKRLEAMSARSHHLAYPDHPPRSRPIFVEVADALDEAATALLSSEAKLAEVETIISDLFAPDGHRDGCLFKDDSRMPCQCDWPERKARYHDAAKRAREIAAAIALRLQGRETEPGK